MKRKIIIGIIVLAAITLISGVSIIAFAAPGSQSDPFISLSFLTDIFKPEIMAEISKTEQKLTQDFNSKAAELESEFQSGNGNSSVSPSASDVFSVVTLNKGQSLTCSVGTEIMLRIGTATGSGSAPALVNYTSGTTLSSGSALTTNHMYLVTIEGNGVKATADTVRVLIRGSYKIT